MPLYWVDGLPFSIGGGADAKILPLLVTPPIPTMLINVVFDMVDTTITVVVVEWEYQEFVVVVVEREPLWLLVDGSDFWFG